MKRGCIVTWKGVGMSKLKMLATMILILGVGGCSPTNVGSESSIENERKSKVNEIVNVERIEPPREVKVVKAPSKNIIRKTYRVTAYCACETCCGKWATNRPVDENGLPIVNGASGVRLKSGISCASPLPFGTTIKLDGYGEVVVHDRTAKWIVEKYGENILDLYFDNHQEALEWGVRYLEGSA